MKKSVKLAGALAVFATPAIAATPNLENPLYNPTAGEFYSKTGIGAMYKKSDDSAALVAKDADGVVDFPVLRINENLGVGITDRLSVRGEFGFTKSHETDRKGLHNGRLGLNYRILNGDYTSGFVWDMYVDAHLGGVMKMEADVVPVSGGTSLGFNYDNYTNGRYGIYLGTRVGKTWDNFTGSGFAELQQTFGSDNNKIGLSSGARSLIGGMVSAGLQAGEPPMPPAQADAVAAMYQAGLPGDFSVMLGSTLEFNAGLNGFWQIDDKWSLGGGFAYKHRQDNEIKSVHLNVESTNAALPQDKVDEITDSVIANSGFMGSMNDGTDEYILSVVVARQFTRSVQVALYGEYTFDDVHPNSQNGTDIKAEAGVRLNVRF